MLEMQLIVPQVVRAFSLSPVPGFSVTTDPGVTLRPATGIELRVQERAVLAH